jgi:hypothetical protein
MVRPEWERGRIDFLEALGDGRLVAGFVSAGGFSYGSCFEIIVQQNGVGAEIVVEER